MDGDDGGKEENVFGLRIDGVIVLSRRHVPVYRLRVPHMTLPSRICHRLSHCFGGIPLSSIHSAWAGDIT